MMLFFQKQQLNPLPPLTLHESNNEGDKKLDNSGISRRKRYYCKLREIGDTDWNFSDIKAINVR